MKSKIGKLNLRVNNLELNAIEEKINEIIDHLNSQDQEEENNFVYTVGTPILESTTTCSQDTPEELIKRKLKEITTSERVGFLYAVGDDDLLANELYDYIQQLLGERETFTKGELNNLLDWIENGYVPSIEARDEIDKRIIEKVVKLLNKK